MKRAASVGAVVAGAIALGAVAISAASCGTLAGPSGGDTDLPSVLSGPFRSLSNDPSCGGSADAGLLCELPVNAPNGFPSYQENPVSSGPATLVRGDLHVVMYAGRAAQTSSTKTTPATIVRFEATDARTFSPPVVALTADQPFEGLSIADPFALDVQNAADGPSVWLVYAVAPDATRPEVTPGIARARSTDALVGTAFEKDTAIVFGADGSQGAWETEPPRAPSLVQLDDGSFRLFYASGSSIGEASSSDGVHFTRLDADPSTPALDPVLGPRGASAGDAAALFDAATVDDPCVDRIVDLAGRVLYRMMYAGTDGQGGRAVGYAGRYGDSGPFEVAAGPVFGPKVHAHAPAMARFDGYGLLYADQDLDSSDQAIGIAVTPTSKTLPLGD